jgi:hypothetical protein
MSFGKPKPFGPVMAVGAVRTDCMLGESDPKPFVWTKPAHDILAKLTRLPVPSV